MNQCSPLNTDYACRFFKWTLRTHSITRVGCSDEHPDEIVIQVFQKQYVEKPACLDLLLASQTNGILPQTLH